jgi:threonine dehydrogenase-like Zn-dependent dehydrogenase
MPRIEALWYVGAGRVERRATDLRAPGAGEVRVAARYSGVSKGTERLVSEGRVPASEHQRMRCPFQEGEFPFAVKYGYCFTGTVEDGPRDLIGRNVFLLHPHQTHAVVPVTALNLLPADLPLRRAALAANMETALNVLWDARAGGGDRILVVGAGVLGLLIAHLAAALPGADVTVSDINPARAAITEKLGATFALPQQAPRDQDIVIHTSANAEGLKLALASAVFEGRIIEASWYGDKEVSLPLGGAFHSQRLSLISSQVGAVATTHRARWTYARRMAKALDLLRDPKLDALITGEIAFADAPTHLPAVFTDAGLMTVLRYT